ncbi:MAG: hypothetical protein H6816_05625 [Phycisphaerales bacterium]|nr:hypothetical protein [Phycisphaerales bacterium]
MTGTTAARRGRPQRGWPALGLQVVLCLFVAVAALRADTIVLKDGTIIDGKIVRKSRRYVRIETKFGTKSYARADIERMIEASAEGSAVNLLQREHDFNKLPDLAQTLKNAQALYDLGRFDEIAPLVEPLIGKGTQADDMQIRWLLIDHNERQAKWDEAEALLKKTLEDGGEADKIRAQAHLDIFKENPGYNLRKINGRLARDFLDRDLYLKGINRNALQDPVLMHAALREVVRQILRDDKVSTYALKDEMDVNETLAAVVELINEKSKRPVVEVLPYREELARVERSLYRARAIQPEATRGFELDLIRTEATHLRDVISALLGRLSDAYPGETTAGADEYGRLTPAGREQWRQQCDDFLDMSRPIEDLIEYLLNRARAFPTELKPFIKEWEDTLERVQQMEQNTIRNRNRTHV